MQRHLDDNKCPKCWGDIAIEEEQSGSNGTVYHVKCNKCGASSSSESMNVAISKLSPLESRLRKMSAWFINEKTKEAYQKKLFLGRKCGLQLLKRSEVINKNGYTAMMLRGLVYENFKKAIRRQNSN